MLTINSTYDYGQSENLRGVTSFKLEEEDIGAYGYSRDVEV